METCSTCISFRVKGEANGIEVGKCDNAKSNEYLKIEIWTIFFKNDYGLSMEQIKQMGEDANKYQTLRFDGRFGCIFHEK